MTLFIAVLPLRLITTTSTNRNEFLDQLAAYIDGDTSLPLSAMDCRQDLQAMQDLRHHITETIREKDAYENALTVLDDMHEYYHCLLECEAKGLIGKSLSLQWESALSGELHTHDSLVGERANLLWNLVTLEAYQATQQSLNSKVGWSKAAQHFQNAASWLQQLPEDLPTDLSEAFLKLWQTLLMAQSQRCIYESLTCAPKPRHLLLAKLAAAAVPLFGDMEAAVRNVSPTTALTQQWADFGRAWGMYMSCKAEHHQAMTSKEKKQWGQEIARLDMAYQFATLCCEYCERAPQVALQPLHTTVDETVRQIQERLQQAQQENKDVHKKPVPNRNELTEIRGEKLVNIDQPLQKLLKPKKGEPMFQGVTDTQHLRNYIDLFHSEMEQMIFQLSNVAEERTDSGRKALATVNLPHSLTAYRQEQAGGGIPDDLWQRVHILQQEKRIAQLKQDLWELRDVAEVARSTYQTIASQLDSDIESDAIFRQENPAFEGHDAPQVQASFRQSLANYDQLLVTAQEGDAVLLNRLEGLDTNPKYKLLQFTKSQLDQLLPGTNGNGSTPGIDTSHLSRLLVDLSGIFHERDVLLETLQDQVKTYDIARVLEEQSASKSDHDYKGAVIYAQKSFDGLVYELQNNLERQTDLISSILSENEQFMMARARSNHSQSADSCIVMIEEAIEEIDQLGKHLREGRDFYDVVIPKLEKLKQQVGDVSARLTVERLEFDDNANRNRQEEEDALFAKQMSTNNTSGPSSSPNREQQPGVAHVDHDSPQVFVDDEKVATLVAMEFDPAKVVAALTKYNNNVDQALNDLLSC